MKAKEQYIVKINLPGGIISAGNLLRVLKVLQELGIETVSFGNRQQLLFSAATEHLHHLRLNIPNSIMEVNGDDYPNIVSSYVTEEVFAPIGWLREGVYKDILDSFNYHPRLKINIVDRHQNLIPFFTGNFNFISSDISNHWYLHVRFPKTNKIYPWPSLIYSADIAEISRLLELIIMDNDHLFYNTPNADGDQLVQMLNRMADFHTQHYDLPMTHTDFHLPFYEGINYYGEHKLWLGIYRRWENFFVDFLIEICTLCMDCRIGQLYTTPWKTILIKNILPSYRIRWSVLLNKYRINVRHASNELNWQLEDRSDEAKELKWLLVKAFEEADLRTSKLCFAIKISKQTGLFGSIIIQKEISEETLYHVMHTSNFNPNSKEFVDYGSAGDIKELGELLIRLCNVYYEMHSTLRLSVTPKKEVNSKKNDAPAQIYQCKHCFTRYDPLYGDSINSISPGTSFDLLVDYNCPTCDARKAEFERVF
ncbi:rubredoxin [Olivibacter jilunii]|uniref:rubredoxin n=1 Tax=Olivibacter jilunii TaxID=985016 RepID=UPI003F15F174